MKASISTNTVTNEWTITIQGLNWEDLQQASFYEGEVSVREVLKLLGQEIILALLRSKAVETPTLEWKGTTYYRQEASSGRYHCGRSIYPSSGRVFGRKSCAMRRKDYIRTKSHPSGPFLSFYKIVRLMLLGWSLAYK